MSAHPHHDRAVIETRGLTVRYPAAHGLEGVDLSVAAGSFVLIGGPSGGGKSTLAHTLMGLIPQTMPAEVDGYISVAGLDPRQHNIAQLATRVGLVFQNPASQLFNGTVQEEVAFGPRNLGLLPKEIASRVAYALEATGCTDIQHRAVRHLSGGEQQRIATAAVLAMRPAVLILDEPTANLDSEGVRLLVQSLVRLHRPESGGTKVTLVVIEHRLSSFLPHADRLIWLADGRLVADGPPVKTLARMQPAYEGRKRESPVSTTKPLVSVREVTAGYGGHPVLQNCSLTLRRGDLAALVGANGTGKTTLARVLAGLLRPRHGRVTWHTNGKKQRVGLLQQNPLHQLVCDTVEEEVGFGLRNLGMKQDGAVDAVLAPADLLSLRRRLTQTLSVGQQQRTALAATLPLRPKLLILDDISEGCHFLCKA